jgi:hypothetical protein
MNNAEKLKNDTLQLFASDSGLYGSPREKKKRRDHVEGLCDRFITRMQSDRPFRTEDEAIQSMAPILAYLFWWAARQLAIAVIRYMWRHWNGYPSFGSADLTV